MDFLTTVGAGAGAVDGGVDCADEDGGALETVDLVEGGALVLAVPAFGAPAASVDDPAVLAVVAVVVAAAAVAAGDTGALAVLAADVAGTVAALVAGRLTAPVTEPETAATLPLCAAGMLVVAAVAPAASAVTGVLAVALVVVVVSDAEASDELPCMDPQAASDSANAAGRKALRYTRNRVTECLTDGVICCA